jgi:uncharacterized protein (DUF697 family)
MIRIRRWWLAGLSLVVLLGLFIPTHHRRILTEGTDTYSTHLPVFDARQVTQTVDITNNLSGLGVLAVNLRRAADLPPLTVTIRDEMNEQLLETRIDSGQLQDDVFSWVSFPPLDGPRTVTLAFSAPEATKSNPWGIRFDAERDRHLAVGVQQRVPVWQQLPLWLEDHPDIGWHLLKVIFGGLLLTFLLYTLTPSTTTTLRPWLLVFTVLAVAAVGIRLVVARQVDSVFGGDAFNYFLKAIDWVRGNDPFASDPRKGPLYTILLLPGLLMPDPLWWGRALGMASATATTIVLPLLWFRFKVPAMIALSTGLILAVNRSFWWESVHSLANIPFALLITLSALALLFHYKKYGRYLVGVLSGLTFLTRYEGALVGAILLPAVWLYHRLNWRVVGYTLLPVLVLVALPLVMWPLTGQLGVRSWSDVQSDEGLNLIGSRDDFGDNWREFRMIFGRTWILAPTVGKQFQTLLAGVGLGIALAVGRRFVPRVMTIVGTVVPYVIAGLILFITFRNANDAQKQLALLMTALMGTGTGYALLRWPRYALPLVLVVVSQALIVTAILTKERYYVHLLPFYSSALVIGVYALSNELGSGWRRFGTIFLIGVLSSTIYLNSERSIYGLTEQYNRKAQTTTIILEPARLLRPQTGTIALAGDYLPMRLYLGDARLKYPPTDEPAGQLQWIQANRIEYVLDNTFDPRFKVMLREYPAYFEEIKVFTTSFKDDLSTLYRVRHSAPD